MCNYFCFFVAPRHSLVMSMVIMTFCSIPIITKSRGAGGRGEGEGLWVCGWQQRKKDSKDQRKRGGHLRGKDKGAGSKEVLVLSFIFCYHYSFTSWWSGMRGQGERLLRGCWCSIPSVTSDPLCVALSCFHALPSERKYCVTFICNNINGKSENKWIWKKRLTDKEEKKMKIKQETKTKTK